MQLDTGDSQSRLASDGISASAPSSSGNTSAPARPSAAAFDPLPPSALAAVGLQAAIAAAAAAAVTEPAGPNTTVRMVSATESLLAQPAVYAEFLSLAFQPYGASAVARNGSGTQPVTANITRLRLTDVTGCGANASCGAVLRVSNLTAPVTFTTPAPAPAAPGRLPLCVFWDEAAAKFSGAGCVALPSPHPFNHSVAWIGSAALGALGGDLRVMATRGWTVSGPSADACETVYIDCASRPGRRAFPTPDNPFRAPSVLCPAASASQPLLRVFVGCELARHENAAGCWWDAERQARVSS